MARVGTWTALGVLFLVLAFAGTAGAQDAEATEPAAGSSARAASAERSVLEEQARDQNSALRGSIAEISAVGDQLEQAQARVDATKDRIGELDRQTGQLQAQIDEQKDLLRESRETYRERARAAYKGENLEGLAALLDGWLGSGKITVGSTDVARVLLESQKSMDEYEENGQMLRNTRRQISHTRDDYEGAVAEQRTASAELHRREQRLDQAIDRLGASKMRTQTRLRELGAAERARARESRAATGVGEADRGHEQELAEDRIVATEVGSTSRERYTELYKASAREYGFGSDWYVLAAVGMVESNHGENMGPSSAGAMGPMQFLPSTWETSGVDGDGDGVANIMDPEDAIPAAAGYLREGGAPRDWYLALYSYNHADWYVKKVLAVAEGYRRLAGDEKVGPYI